jgi:hypothetical protein
MGVKIAEKLILHGNFAEISDKRPDSYEEEYKVMIPYDEMFKNWDRVKVGKTVCDCVMVKECYQPYYGFDWYHSEECALIKRLKANPQLENLPCWQGIKLLAQSE